MTSDFNIINKIPLKDRPAKFVRIPDPTFRTNYEKDKHWDIEKKRFLEGYGGLTGPHYFYIQQCKIKLLSGATIRPWWRDADDLIFNSYDEARKIEWDLYVLKRREIGLSSIFGGCLPMYHAIMNPGSISLMTSADKDRIKALFSEKWRVVYDGLHPHLKSPLAKTRQEGYALLADEQGDKKSEKRYEGLGSQIISKETVKNPKALESFRAIYAFLDELFLHPKPLKVHASALRCFMESTKKKGTMVMGGTCGVDDDDKKGIAAIGLAASKRLYMESQHHEILTLFLGGTIGLTEFSYNGWSDEKAAYDWIMRKRDVLGKAEDKTTYYKFVTDYPITVDEVLNMVPDAVLPQQILFMLDQAEKKIASENIVQQPYELFRLDNNLIQAKPVNIELAKAKFVIIHPPEKGLQYSGGTDPIPFGNASMADGSDWASIIKRQKDQRHVAYYKERNMDPDETVKNAIMLQDLYTQVSGFNVQTMLEFTRGEAAMLTYVNLLRTELLYEMPQHLGITFEKRKYPWGVSKNPHIEARGNKYLLNWLWKNAGNVRLKLLIDELRWYLKVNHDLLDAMIMELFIMENEIAKNKKIGSRQLQPTTVHEVIRDTNGVTRRVTKTINAVSNTTIGDLMDRALRK